MEYEMRALKTLDIFKMSKILKKLNLNTSEIKIDEGMTQTKLGVSLIQKALENLHQAEDEVNEFLAGLVGIDPKDFSELPIEETLEIITLFKDQKGIANFLKLAGK